MFVIESFQIIDHNIYGVDLFTGRITPSNSHCAELFYIVDTTNNEEFNMNQISQALGNLEQGQTTNVSCKDILGREYDVEVKGGTSFNSYYGDASRLFG